MNTPSNLPPGCTDNDVERAAGSIDSCKECGREMYAEKLEDGACPKCRRDKEEE